MADIFAICKADSIEPESAKAFSLSRLAEEGGSRPYAIVVIRTTANDYLGYLNACPHQGVWLNIGAGEFFTPGRDFLRCGRHGANFEIDTGLCVDGPCKGQYLEPIPLAVIDGDICLCGVALAEDDGLPDSFGEDDGTMEIMIHPD